MQATFLCFLVQANEKGTRRKGRLPTEKPAIHSVPVSDARVSLARICFLGSGESTRRRFGHYGNYDVIAFEAERSGHLKCDTLPPPPLCVWNKR